MTPVSAFVGAAHSRVMSMPAQHNRRFIVRFPPACTTRPRPEVRAIRCPGQAAGRSVQLAPMIKSRPRRIKYQVNTVLLVRVPLGGAGTRSVHLDPLAFQETDTTCRFSPN